MGKTDIEKVINDLMAIPEEDLKNPNIPVNSYVQEAEDLEYSANKDKEALTSHGLEWSFVDSLSTRTGALREAQSNWLAKHKAQKEAEKEWIEKSPVAFKFRDSLLNAYRYGFRKDKALLSIVAIIADGYSRDDMIQDLNDLAVLGRENTAPLQSINFDLDKLEQAAEMSATMAKLLAKAKGEDGSSESLIMRNRAFTYLKQAVDEIRGCGKYTFSGKEEKLKEYRSEFMSKLRKKAETETETPAETAENVAK